MGIRIEYLGGIVCASVDWNAFAVQHVERNTAGPVFQMDIHELATVKTVHQACPRIGTTTLGFPRQPLISGQSPWFRRSPFQHVLVRVEIHVFNPDSDSDLGMCPSSRLESGSFVRFETTGSSNGLADPHNPASSS